MKFLRLLLLSLAVIFSARAAEMKPNIVLILADDLGINDLHCYGRAEHHTPNLDRLAEQGIRFTDGYCAQAICSASRAALMTGKCPARLHLTNFLPGRADAASQRVKQPIIEGQLPLEEMLFGTWHCPHCRGKVPAMVDCLETPWRVAVRLGFRC